MIKIDSKTLVNFLEIRNYQPKIQGETNQIYLLLKISGKDFPLFIRIFDDSDLLQLLAFMPCQIDQRSVSDLARLLHLINKELDIPGFGMDESSGVTFYRCMLPTPGKHIDEKLLETYLKSIQLICESISPGVIAVASGQATYEEIIKLSQNSNSSAR